MVRFGLLLLMCLWGAIGQAIEPQPLQFATTAPQAEEADAEPDSVPLSEEPPVHTTMGKAGVWSNPRLVGLLATTLKTKINGIARDQKAYLDAIEQQEGKKARQEAEDKLARYRLLSMDEQGLDYRTFNNTIHADPKAAAQELLDRVDAVKRPDLTKEDYEALSEMSEAQFMLTTGMSTQEWTALLVGEPETPAVQGERFWTP